MSFCVGRGSRNGNGTHSFSPALKSSGRGGWGVGDIGGIRDEVEEEAVPKLTDLMWVDGMSFPVS